FVPIVWSGAMDQYKAGKWTVALGHADRPRQLPFARAKLHLDFLKRIALDVRRRLVFRSRSRQEAQACNLALGVVHDAGIESDLLKLACDEHDIIFARLLRAHIAVAFEFPEPLGQHFP